MGNIHDDTFPGEQYEKVKTLLKRFNRDTLLSNYWYRYLINPVCIADVTKDGSDLSRPITLITKPESFYERLIVEVINIRESNQWEIFMDNISKYYQRSIGYHEVY